MCKKSKAQVISWACRSKDALDIAIDHLCILEENEQIRMVGMRGIDEAQRHRDQIRSRSIDARSNIDSGLGGITAGQFNNFDLPL